MLQRLLYFLEESGILDRNYGLIGERFENVDLRVRERPNFSTANQNRSDWNAFSKKWCAEHRPSTVEARSRLGERKFHLGLCLKVVDVNEPSLDHSPASHRVTIQRGRRIRGPRESARNGLHREGCHDRADELWHLARRSDVRHSRQRC